MSTAHEGHCHICNEYGKLTFEHFPPKSAYNDRPIRFYTGEEYLKPEQERKYCEQQRGFGDYTLCERCNTLTGRWYVPSYKAFIAQALEYQLGGYNGKTVIPFYICPANVLKQIVTMMMSVHQYGLCQEYPYLQKYLLNKEQKYLPPDIRVFIFAPSRFIIRKTGRLGGLTLNPMRTCIFCEFIYPPLGYILTFDDQSAGMQIEDGKKEITFFSRYGYDESDVMWLKIPVIKIMPDIQ